MNLQQGLRQRVTALRQRLAEMEPLAPAQLPAKTAPALQRLQQVQQQILHVRTENDKLETTLADLATATAVASLLPLPRQLTWRARRLLLHGRDLLEQLKQLAGSLHQADSDQDHLAVAYREALTMTELSLRAVQSFPHGPGDQLKLCDGLEAMLGVVADRLVSLRAMMERQHVEQERLETLAHLLESLVQGRPVLLKPFRDLAKTLAHEVHPLTPLRLLHASPETPAHWAAAHSLNVAQVLARFVRHDPEWQSRLDDVILAGLVHDAGMAAVPPEILAFPRPLQDEQRRQIEAHAGLSAQALRALAPNEGWLVDAVAAHHERMDGTGYPAGVQGKQIPALARLLAVCDVYVALASPRPHRPALSPRAALTETLLEAEKGRLDAKLAEYLLNLSFYPVGTVVELADGRIGVVIAPNPARGDLAAPARPIVQLLLGESGKSLPWPEHLNLAECEGRHIVRSLTPEESREILCRRYWHLL